MKRYILFLALAAISFSSCSKEDQPLEIHDVEIVQESPIFHATTESNTPSGTKAYMNENLKVVWNNNDFISIFNKTTENELYRFLGNDGDSEGDFERLSGTDPAVITDIDKVFAVYPYNSETEINSNGVLTVLLPSEQTYRANSFGVGANTMVAVSDNTDLSFKNVCGYLRLKLYGDNTTISEVTITGNNDEILGGQATVTVDQNGIPTAQMITDPENTYKTKKVRINCDEVSIGATSDAATEFCFVIPPITLSNGFTLTVYGYKDGQYGRFVKSTSSSVAITRNVRRNMAALKVELEPLNYVEFEDDTFKAYCVANFDVDGDGEISKAEAMAVDMIQCFNSSPSHDYYYEEQGGKRYDYMYATSLKGIEEFENLQTLNIAGSSIEQGPLTSLDLSQNTALKTAWIYNNDISDLDISGCTLLEDLNCSNTRIGEIYVFGFEKLESLIATDCSYLKFINCGYCTSLSELDITGCGNLNWIDCASTLLTSLDLSNRTLRYVNCSDCSQLGTLKLEGSSVTNTIIWEHCPKIKNFLFSRATIANWPTGGFGVFPALQVLLFSYTNYDSDLDLTGNTALERLECLDAGITSINVSGLSRLTEITCAGNNLTAITGLSGLTALSDLNFAQNKIEEIDIHNNTALTKVTAWPQKEGFSLHTVVLTPTQATNIAWWDTTHQLTDTEIGNYGTIFDSNY